MNSFKNTLLSVLVMNFIVVTTKKHLSMHVFSPANYETVLLYIYYFTITYTYTSISTCFFMWDTAAFPVISQYRVANTLGKE
jgi:hypothetical protein